MRKKIVTIGRQIGSGGHEIGERLAKKLNVPLYDRNLVEKAIEELNLSRVDMNSFDEKLLGKFAKGYQNLFGEDRPYYLGGDGGIIGEQLYHTQEKIIERLAEQGPCVFVGRCADHILRERDDVLSVFICADKEQRIRRLMKKWEESREYVEFVVKEKDTGRSRYYKSHTGREWGLPETYHMVLNVSRLGMDNLVDLLAKIMAD